MSAEDRLSPAARQAMDAYVSEVRDQILARSLDEALMHGESREISVSDVLAALSEPGLRSAIRTRRMHLLVRAYAAVGLFAVLLGAGFLVVPTLSALNQEQRLGALLIIGGVLMTYVAGLLAVIFRAREARLLGATADRSRPDRTAGAFLHEWALFEADLRRAVVATYGESEAVGPLRHLLDLALRSDSMTADMADVQKLLKLRNEIAHGQRHADTGELMRAIQMVHRLREQLGSAGRVV